MVDNLGLDNVGSHYFYDAKIENAFFKTAMSDNCFTNQLLQKHGGNVTSITYL